MKRAVQLAGVALVLFALAGMAKHPSPTLSLALLLTAAASVAVAVGTIVAGRRAHDAAGGPDSELLEQAESRVGRPLQLLCPFTLLAQDRPGECWQGRQYLWLGLDGEQLWLLHDAHRHPGYGRQPSSAWLPRIGGVWDRLPRHGLTARSRELRRCHQLELSWPHAPRLLVARIYGPRAVRRELIGLLAADELGLRAETEGRAHV